MLNHLQSQPINSNQVSISTMDFLPIGMEGNFTDGISHKHRFTVTGVREKLIPLEILRKANMDGE